MWQFDWLICLWPWPILKVKVKLTHISTVNISQMVTDGQTLQLLTDRKSDSVVFQLLDLNLTVVYSWGKFGSWNGFCGIFSPSSLFIVMIKKSNICMISSFFCLQLSPKNNNVYYLFPHNYLQVFAGCQNGCGRRTELMVNCCQKCHYSGHIIGPIIQRHDGWDRFFWWSLCTG